VGNLRKGRQTNCPRLVVGVIGVCDGCDVHVTDVVMHNCVRCAVVCCGVL
jgi:hypothetical protein